MRMVKILAPILKKIRDLTAIGAFLTAMWGLVTWNAELMQMAFLIIVAIAIGKPLVIAAACYIAIGAIKLTQLFKAKTAEDTHAN